MLRRVLIPFAFFTYVIGSLFVYPQFSSAALYAPGETLDPSCAPTDVDCGITPGIASSTAGSIPYYALNGSTLSATSALTVSTNGDVSLTQNLFTNGNNFTRSILWADQYRESSNSQYNPASNALGGRSTGAVWEEAGTDSLPLDSANYGNGLVYDGKMWLFGGWKDDNTLTTRKIYNSTNGIDWTEVGTDSLPYEVSGTAAVVYDGKMWLIGGCINDCATASRKVYSSTDGITWTEAGTNALPIDLTSHGALVFHGKMWAIGGGTNNQSTLSRKVYSSTDGVTWTEAGTNALPIANNAFAALVYNDKMWVIGGASATGDSRKVWFSADGITWTEAGTDALPIRIESGSGANAVVYDGKMWLIGGWSYDHESQKALYSTDGITWSEASTDSLPMGLTGSISLVYDGKLWALGGMNNGVYTHKAYYSSPTIRGGLTVTDSESSSLFTVTASGNVGIGSTTPNGKLVVNSSGSDISPLIIKTNGSVGNYTATNSGIFMYDAAGNETFRLVASDPDISHYNDQNLYIGGLAGAGNPSDNVSAGFNNTGVGYGVLTSNTTGYENEAFGSFALTNNTTGLNNVAMGAYALYGNVGGNDNIAIGVYALPSITQEDGNVAIGAYALNLANGGSYNTVLGDSAGYGVTTGAHNILIGAAEISASYNQITTGSNNISIGYSVAVPSQTASNQLNIGNLIYGIGLDGTGHTLSSGNIGIGTTSPAYLLHVGNTSKVGVVSRFENSTGYCDINPTTTSLTCTSDRRLKKNILTLDSTSTLEALLKLEPVTYNWLKEDDASSTHAGFIAQDVREIFPDLVSEDPNGILSVSYSGFIPYIVESIKEIAAVLEGWKENFVSNRVTTDTLCVKKESGEDVCVTGESLEALINAQDNNEDIPHEEIITPPSEEEVAPEDTPPPEEEGSNPEDVEEVPAPSEEDDATVTETPSDSSDPVEEVTDHE